MMRRFKMIKKLKHLMFIILLFPYSANAMVYNLQEAINTALKNSTLIKESIEKQKSAQAHYRSAKDNMFPKISLSYNYTRLRNKPYSIVNMTGTPSKMIMGDKNSIQWNMTIAQPIFTGFALSTQKKIADLGIDISRIQKEKAILDVVKNVKVAYFNILLSQKYLKVANEAVMQLEAHKKDAENLYKEGIIPYNDLLKSQVALSNAIQNRANAKNNVKLAVSRFNILLRKSINEENSVEDILSFNPIHFNLKSLMERAITKRPEMRELNTMLRQAQLGVKLAKSSYYPQISAFAQYQQSGDDITASTNHFSNDHNALFGVKVDWTIFEFGKKQADVEEQRHNTFALEEKIESIKDSIRLEVKDAYLKLKTAKENIKTTKVGLKQAKENYRITNLQYKQQITTSTEVLDARVYLTQAELNYYNALYGYYIALANLKRAIGEQ
jgi:outer membrane protein